VTKKVEFSASMSGEWPKFDSSKHHIFDLEDMRRSRPVQDASGMFEDFREKGWCFVKLPEKFPFAALAELTQQVEHFFSLDEKTKQLHSGPFGFGYSSLDHKEGIRVLTGLRRWEFEKHNLVPGDLIENFAKISTFLDELSLLLTLSLAKPFGIKPSSLAKLADIPVAYGRHFGMLDMALYYNKQKSANPPPPVGSSVNEVNCVPHYDPGLLSISFMSTNEGLQLLDPRTGEWISGPNNSVPDQRNIAVVWLGEAAVKVSNTPVKAGIHRVIYPQVAEHRLTMWYEMCTVTQAEPPEEEVLPEGNVSVASLLGAEVEVKPGETKFDILRKIERNLGVPPSKVRRIDDSFHYTL